MKRRKFLNNIAFCTGSSALFSLPVLGSNITKNNDIVENGLNIDENRKITSIQVTVPSTVKVNEKFWIGIRILTEPYFVQWSVVYQRKRATVNSPFNRSPRGIQYMENVLPEWKGSVKIFGDEGYKGLSSYSFADGAGPFEMDSRPVRRINGFSFSSPGIKFIRVIDPVSGIEGISNPVHVNLESPKERLFWGDPHCHSFFGDAIRSPEELYAFARDESFLDIFAVTEHVEALSDTQWNHFADVANSFNESGRFVTFVGGEWTSRKYGHRNFIYPGNYGPIIRSSDPDQQHLQQLYAIARSHKALIIANHPASPSSGIDWSQGHDPEVERLVDVYSIGGNCEIPEGPGNNFPSRIRKKEKKGSYVVDALAKGYRFGMMGSGDEHDGRPGDAMHNLQESPADYRYLLGPGLMGVWARELTRESVFDALWNRRVYATTNNRTWLKFSINGYSMGSEIRIDGKIAIKVEVASNIVIQRIDLVREGKTVKFIEPSLLEIVWDTEEDRLPADTWYYVRVTLDNEHLAWSSPIWISV